MFSFLVYRAMSRRELFERNEVFSQSTYIVDRLMNAEMFCSCVVDVDLG
jgi:hypothetical protein